ncbi:hypothetical protein GCM10007160_14700 [Litchfieldella qijiaojingensis]|uniref:TraX n=1 Tax=Litchfieldella qijiaojingensis TaxID=980347 RepID=A0ABQ2YP33_9GAMM|nr:TraX family protein [Halomonas qijiaojingensis]GGX88310.1 hypothetical protein GCM10007160_14700 [Halomonas qijiaojingensis]
MSTSATAMPGAIRPSSSWTGWGQWLALVTMTIDHLTRYVVPASWDLTWAETSIGRIAFPLFAAMVAWHALFNTRNPLRYARRILVIGVIAQFPYMLMPRASDALILNICFTLAAGLAWGAWWRELLERHRDQELSSGWLASGMAASLVVWMLLGNWVEYGHHGLLLVPLYMLAMHHLSHTGETLTERLLAVSATLPVLIVAGLMNSSDMAKSFTVATCLLILLLSAGAARHVPEITMKMPRRLWLAWYPGHFAAIALWLWLAGGLS